MMKSILKNKNLISLFLVLSFVAASNAQVANDSLTLKNIISRVINNNPLLKQSDEKVNTSRLKEKLVKSEYLPNLSAGASVNRIFPVPAFDLPMPDPQTGDLVATHFQMSPDFAMDYGVRVNQMIYDFGKTDNKLGLQQTYTEISKLNTDQIKQKLALTTANYFYVLVYIQSAIKIKADEMGLLKQHLEYVVNKQKTGSATQYEILSTKVRISVTETQLAELNSSQEVQLSHLNNLMDTTGMVFFVKDFSDSESYAIALDSSANYAMAHRTEILLAEKNTSLAKWNYKFAESKNNPSLQFIGSTGFKNGYLANINSLKYYYMAGLSLNVPIFDGNRKHIDKQIANSGIAETSYEMDNIRNTVTDEVKENYVSMQLALQKINQFSAQLKQAIEAYNHAQINYETGAITNLDLLDASNTVAESKLLLLKSKIDYSLYLIKFRAAIGERLYE